MGKRVLLLGATGSAGRAALGALIEAGHRVVCLVRRAAPPMPQGAESVVCDLSDPAALARLFHVHRVDAVMSCMASRTGAPGDAWAVDHAAHRAVLRAAQAARVAQWVQLSAICVQKPKLAFQHAKLAFEADLLSSGLVWSIVRPTAFFKSLSGQFDRVRAGKPYLLFGDGELTACKPISDRDLGRFLVACLDRAGLQRAVLPIGGPGPALTPRAQGEALFAALELAPRFRRVPVALLDAVIGGLSLAGLVHRGSAAKAELARIGRYYATESMLVLNEAGVYDAAATPETGEDRLADFFADLAAGRASLERGDHAVF